ncbi:MAG: fatty acid kinase [Actinomycetota bacterium]|nr:fatty acid kinase [Actinomycetota bacterium]
MLNTLDGRDAQRWAAQALSALGRFREEIDALNVFPVPDGDTGTNLYLTLEAACAEALKAPQGTDPREVGAAFARGALLGARGNSGIIVAQLLQGWVEVFSERGLLDAAAVKRAMTRADEQAWAAVGSPVAGTILSVSRAAVHAAQGAGDRLDEVVSAATHAARKALEHTPTQLESLRRAGVVDAGGRGLLVLLETLEGLVRGTMAPEPAGSRSLSSSPSALPGPPTPQPRPTPWAQQTPWVPPTPWPQDPTDGPGPAYEVMYLLRADAPGIEALRERLSGLGECLAIVGGEGQWHVHVHVNDPGAAVEVGIEVGEPSQIRIERLEHGPEPGDGVSREVGGLVACAAGPGLASLFSQAGAVTVPVRPGLGVDEAELLRAVWSTGVPSVALLPNDPRSAEVAQAVARSVRVQGTQVVLVPTLSPVQGLAAAAVHDAGRPFDEDVARMSSAAGATGYGAVTVAVRDVLTPTGLCREGELLGTVLGEPAVSGSDPVRVAGEVVSRLLAGGGELLTLVTGLDAPEGLLRELLAGPVSLGDHVEVSEHYGGQPGDLLLVGVE